MKKIYLALIVVSASFGLFAFTYQTQKVEKQAVVTPPVEAIKWITWEEAVKLNETKPKKFVIDVYTEWCGWCKKMDREIFTDTNVAKYVAENYYAVKLDAEQKQDIIFGGKTYKFISQGRSGYNEFAAALLDGNMGYPTLVYLSEKYERTVISPGYKDVPTLIKEMKFTAEEHYKNGTWDDYQKSK